MIRRPPRSTLSSSSAASDVYKRQGVDFNLTGGGVHWLAQVAQLTGTTHDVYASLSGKNIQLAIANGPVQTIPLTTETTASQVAVTLNAYFLAHSIAALASSVAGLNHANGTV